MLTLILYRVAANPRRIVSQLDWAGYDDEPVVVLVDGKNKLALAAATTCFELLSHRPVTKTVGSPITPALIAQTMAGVRESAGLVLGEAGLEATAHALAGSSVGFDAGEAAILEVEQDAWASAFQPERSWNWQGTLTPSEAR